MNFLHYSMLVSSVLMGLSLDYWWVFWLSMEVSLWALTPFLFSDYSSLLSFVYWQSLSSLLFIVVFIFMKFKLCLILLVLKMSLPPFHVWFLNLLKNVSWKFFLLFIFISKLPYIMIFSNFWSTSIFNFFLLFPGISFFYFWVLLDFKYVIWVMSISDYPWSYLVSKSFYLMMLYFMITILVMMMFMSAGKKYKLILVVLFLLGLPPFSIFQIKMMILAVSPLLKVSMFLTLLFFNFLFMYLYIFSSWFALNHKLSKKWYTQTVIFMLLNFLWVMF